MLLRWLVVVCFFHVVMAESPTPSKRKQEDPCAELSCEHLCTIKNGSASCDCRDGFTLSKDQRSCKDADECSPSIWPPKCSQMCQNIDGGFVCSCDTEHYKLLHNTTCKAKGERPKLIYSSTNEIVVKILNFSMSEIKIENVHSPAALSYSPFGHNVYWIDKAGATEHVFRRGIYDVFGTPEIVVSVSGRLNGIAVDWITSNLYITKGKQLLVCGSSFHVNCKTMWNSSEIIGDVIASPAERQVYWIEGKYIMKCSSACALDGSSPHFIASTDMRTPRSLVIDRPTRTVYWTDYNKRTIESSSIDGHNKDRKVVLKVKVSPIAVAIFEDTVYWTDGTAIHAANKFTGEVQADPFAPEEPHSWKSHYYPVNIILAHSSIQTMDTSPCVFAECSQLGLPSPSQGCVCACDDQSEAMEDGVTCRMERKSPHLLLTTGDQIYQVDFQAMSSPKLVASMGHRGMFDLLAYDPVSDVIIVYKSSNKTIYGVKPNNESNNWVIFSGNSVGGLAVDELNGNVYWTVSAEGIVMATAITSPKEPITTAHMFQIPQAITIASKEGLVFVADLECNCIFRMSLDGSKLAKVVSEVSPVSMTVTTLGDPSLLIWSDVESESIRSIKFDGTNSVTIKPFIESGSDLLLHGKMLYWLPRNATYIYYANNYGHESINYMMIDPYIADTGVAHHMALMNAPSTSSSPCLTPSNICEYFCSSDSNGTKCLCPNGMSLEHGKCAHAVCQYGSFKCDNGCLPNWHRCNGKKDCKDESDETGCRKEPKQCRTHEFQCKNKNCIPLGWKCDDEKDCTDASDEQECPPCPKGNWKCKTQSRCIMESWVCDGREDCRDGSDETPELCKDFPCRKNQFKCDHGGCIEMSEKCDGFEDCSDKSDENEKNCLPVCGHLKVGCNDGTCIPRLFQCDGEMDCPGGEDELPPVCPTPKIHNCTCPLHTHFRCKETPSICFPIVKRCNGVPDCPSGSDENQCPTYCPVSLDTQKCLQLCEKFNFPFCQRSKVTSWKVSPCDQHSWQCPKSRACISLVQTCDGKPDCPQGEDEGERCDSVCYNNGGCDYRCHPTPFGPRCSCHAGYILGKDRKSCIDYDECKSVEGYCSQMCIDKSGGIPMCKCGEGYKLERDRRTCKAMGERGRLVFALSNSIRMLNLANNNLESLLTTERKISGISYDANTFNVYWTEVSCNITTVKKMRIHDGKTETVTAMEGDSTSISYDWLNNNLYISRELHPDYAITICSMKSLQCSDIIGAYGGKQIASVVVDPVSRKLFWIESISKRFEHMTRIRSSRLDGADDTTLKEYAPYAKGLALDLVLSKVYWSDAALQAIFSMDFDGNRTRMVLTARNELSHPHALAVFEDSIYFSNLDALDPYEPSPPCIDNSNLTACNKFTGDRCKNIHRHHSGAHSIALTNKVLQPKLKTACEKSACTGICVPRGETAVCIRGKINQVNGPCDVIQVEVQTVTTAVTKEFAPTSKPQLDAEDSGSTSGGLAAGIVIPILLLLLIGAGFLYMRNQKNSEYMQSPLRIPFTKGRDSVLMEEDELQKQQDETSNPTARSNKSFSWNFHKGRTRLEEEL